MNRSVWSRTGVGAAVAAVMLSMGGQSVQAADDDLALKMSGAVNPGRFFVRAGAIYIKVKTKSGDAYDVTGPVVTRQELEQIFVPGVETSNPATTNPGTAETQIGKNALIVDKTNPVLAGPTEAAIRRAMMNLLRGPNGVQLLLTTMNDLGVDALGTPQGVKAEAKSSMGTAGVSIGYFLDEDQKWVAEAYVLAAPLRTSAVGRGTTSREVGSNEREDQPMAIDGQKIVETKLLPPTVIFGRQWADKRAAFRPFTGLMGTYAMFFDTKATNFLNSYVGGSNPGDTTVSMKNAFGVGPVVGLTYNFGDNWQLNLNVGHVKLKTVATLTTRNTRFTADTAVLTDLGRLYDPISAAQGSYGPANCSSVACTALIANGGVVGATMRAVAAVRGNADGNLGTYVRKQELTLSNTLFMLSIGKSF